MIINWFVQIKITVHILTSNKIILVLSLNMTGATIYNVKGKGSVWLICECLRDHPFNTCSKFSGKLTFLWGKVLLYTKCMISIETCNCYVITKWPKFEPNYPMFIQNLVNFCNRSHSFSSTAHPPLEKKTVNRVILYFHNHFLQTAPVNSKIMFLWSECFSCSLK